MSSFDSSDVLFFFGAGASAPFNIPTMKQFVTHFEHLLDEKGSAGEKELYNEIKTNPMMEWIEKVDTCFRLDF